jgi:hypothetical protein
MGIYVALMSQAGPALVVAATGAAAATAAARQLMRGRSRSRGEWERTLRFFWRACADLWVSRHAYIQLSSIGIG